MTLARSRLGLTWSSCGLAPQSPLHAELALFSTYTLHPPMHSFYTNAVLQAMALAVVVALICPASGAHYQLDRTSATRETHGRSTPPPHHRRNLLAALTLQWLDALERIYRDVEVSQSVHSLCWKRAVENLVEGCKAMDGTKDPSLPFCFCING